VRTPLPAPRDDRPLPLLPRATSRARAAARVAGARTGWLTPLSGTADIIFAVCLLMVALVMIPAAWNFRKLAGRLGHLAAHLRDHVQPGTGHAEAIGQNEVRVS
jgi:hypothetical protein